jgi:apolipoprotein N-acyltransferase
MGDDTAPFWRYTEFTFTKMRRIIMTTYVRSQAKEAQVTQGVRIAVGIALSVLSGIMLLLSFPPYGAWPLVWVAFVPYLFAQYRLLPCKWSSLAPATAMLLWLGPFMARLFGTEFGPIFTYLGVLIAILAYFTNRERKFIERTGYRWFILHGVLTWVGFEMIRATVIPLVATSAFIGYTQASQAWVTQPVSVFSVYGLNLAIMLTNFALTQGAMAWFDRRWQPEDVVLVDGRATRNWLLVMGVVLVVWFGMSMAILGVAPKDAPTVRVAALQPNYAKPAFQDEVVTSRMRFDAFADWARQAAQQGAQIIYTPEMAFNFDPQVEYTAEFRALAEETGAYILINYTVAKEGEDFRNEAVLLSPSGEFSDVYAKNHAPPGEPLSPTAGAYPVYDTPLGRLAAMICHDGNYTDVARKLTRNKAQLIGAGLNEFGGFGEQYWTNITFRALENRTAMVVTSRATGSAIIDPYGRQVALTLNPGEQAVLVGDVSLGSGDGTLFTTLGDWLGWLSLASWVFFVIFQMVEERRHKKAREQEKANAAS